jgi:outer membrane beta-barrel protein
MKRFATMMLLLALLFPVAAAAKEGPLDGAPPILRQTLWREGRFEIAPTVGVTMPDPFTGSVAYEQLTLVGLQANYFILDWLSVGLDLGYGIATDTDLHEQVDRELSAKQNALCPDPGPTGSEEDKAARQNCLGQLKLTDRIRTASPELLVALNAGFVPVQGKFMVFDGLLLHYDVHMLVGVGMALMRGEPDDKAQDIFGGLRFGPVVGIGARTFFNDWFGLNVEFRDTIIDTSLVTDQTGKELGSDFRNYFTFTLGISFVLPPETRHEIIEF